MRADCDLIAAGALRADAIDEVTLEAGQLAVVQRGVDGRDQVGALGQDGDPQRLGRQLPISVRHLSTW